MLTRLMSRSQLAVLVLCSAGLARVTAQPLDDTNAPPAGVNAARLTGGGSVAARALANQVNDPTAPVTLIQFRDVTTPSIPGHDSPANVLQVEPVFPIFPTRVLPFEQLVKMTLPFPTTPSPGSQTGLGDFSLFD